MPRILIVDDDFTTKLELEEMLSMAGYEVVGDAESGEQALSLAKDLAPDLILMDIMLKGDMDGISAAEIIKGESNIPVVFMTGYGDPDFIERAKRLEPFGYVMKPFDETEVKAFVEIALYKSKIERQLEAAHKKLEKTNQALKREIEKRRKSDQAIKAEEEKYRLHFEHSSDVIYSVNRQFKVVNVSPSVEKILGFPPSEMIGKTVQELNVLAPSSFEKAISDTMRVLAGESIAFTEYEFIAKDGRKVIGEVSGAPVIRDGRIVGTVSVARDVTERKSAQDAIRESEEKYRFLAENMADIVWMTDQNFRTSYVTPSIETVLGFTQEERKKQSLEEMITPDSVRRARMILTQEMQREMEGNADPERSITMDIEYYRKDGSTLWMESCVKFIRDKNGSVAGLLGATRDISKRKCREEEIERLRQEWEGIFQAIGNPTLIIDRDHNIIQSNAATEEATGKSREDLVGMKCHGLFHLSDRPPEACPLVKMLNSGRLETVEMEIEALNGRFLVSCTPMLDRDGRIEKVIHIATDITERKRAEMERERLEAQLRQIRKMEAISTLTGGIAHDYNNLLSIIMGNLSMALDEVKPGSDLKDFLSAADIASRKVRDLTHELMALSKGGDPFKELGSLKEVLKHAGKAVPGESGIVIRESICHDLWPVSFDPHQMGAVFRNLLTNAVEAMSCGGTLTIKGENLQVEDGERHPDLPLQPGEYVRISLVDQGRGIPPEHLDKVFDPYFSTKAMGIQKGMGLGLTTAYAIVQKHGGHMSVESKSGLGTTVKIYLPAERHRAGAEAKRHPEDDAISLRKRVLLMDDEEMLRKLAQQMLKKLGYEVETVKDGIEAIEAYERQRVLGTPFDAVILDLTVKGGMGGEQTIGKLLKLDPAVKAIVSSGYFDDPVMSHFEAYGFRGAMAKPYEKSKLKEELEKLLD